MKKKLSRFERFLVWLEDTPEEIAEREAKIKEHNKKCKKFLEKFRNEKA